MHRPCVAASRFNEAPIHESGKYHDARTMVAGQANGFNEAPIHESGKFKAQVEPLMMFCMLQ